MANRRTAHAHQLRGHRIDQACRHAAARLVVNLFDVKGNAVVAQQAPQHWQ
jgi:hypothetical protein